MTILSSFGSGEALRPTISQIAAGPDVLWMSSEPARREDIARTEANIRVYRYLLTALESFANRLENARGALEKRSKIYAAAVGARDAFEAAPGRRRATDQGQRRRVSFGSRPELGGATRGAALQQQAVGRSPTPTMVTARRRHQPQRHDT